MGSAALRDTRGEIASHLLKIVLFRMLMQGSWPPTTQAGLPPAQRVIIALLTITEGQLHGRLS